MTISEAAQHLGVSAHTLRYYEKIGLIRHVERAGGRRVYTSQDMAWLEFIMRLKVTAMPLARIKKIADLRYQGDATMDERKAMLLSHRENLKAEIVKLQGHLHALDRKIDDYTALQQQREQRETGENT
ncbi:MAG: MerR family transcriptional regulator [Desulfovibrio sp.]|nr:MAG: MerR family transcriptional regulator [Desulfovibrio sp.]